VGRLTLDWLYLHKFLSNFLENWSAGNSLVLKNRLALLVYVESSAIASQRAMFNQGEFWEVWGKAEA
jgi:hypothetical protein